MRITLKNVSSVDLGGKKAGSIFKVPATDDGVPADLYWRKRIADGSVVTVVAPVVKPQAPVVETASPAADSKPPAAAPVVRPAPRAKKD